MRLPITQLLMADGAVHSLPRNRIRLKAATRHRAIRSRSRHDRLRSCRLRGRYRAARAERPVNSGPRNQSPAQAVTTIRRCGGPGTPLGSCSSAACITGSRRTAQALLVQLEPIGAAALRLGTFGALDNPPAPTALKVPGHSARNMHGMNSIPPARLTAFAPVMQGKAPAGVMDWAAAMVAPTGRDQ